MHDVGQTFKMAIRDRVGTHLWKSKGRLEILGRMLVRFTFFGRADEVPRDDGTRFTPGNANLSGPGPEDRYVRCCVSFLQKARFKPAGQRWLRFLYQAKELVTSLEDTVRALLNTSVMERLTFIDPVDPPRPATPRRRSRSADSIPSSSNTRGFTLSKLHGVVDAVMDAVKRWKPAETELERDINQTEHRRLARESERAQANAVAARFTPEFFENRLALLEQDGSAPQLEQEMQRIADDLYEVVRDAIQASELNHQEQTQLIDAFKKAITWVGRGRLSDPPQFLWETLCRIFTTQKVDNACQYWGPMQAILALLRCHQTCVILCEEEVRGQTSCLEVCSHHSVKVEKTNCLQQVKRIMRESHGDVVWYLFGHMENHFGMLLDEGRPLKHDDIKSLVDFAKGCFGDGRCNLRLVFVNGCGTKCGNNFGEQLHAAGVPCVVYWDDKVIPDVATRFAHEFFKSYFTDQRGEQSAFEAALKIPGVEFGVSPEDAERVGACSGRLKSTNNDAGSVPMIQMQRRQANSTSHRKGECRAYCSLLPFPCIALAMVVSLAFVEGLYGNLIGTHCYQSLQTSGRHYSSDSMRDLYLESSTAAGVELRVTGWTDEGFIPDGSGKCVLRKFVRYIDPRANSRIRKDKHTKTIVKLENVRLAVVSHTVCSIDSAIEIWNTTGVMQHYLIDRFGDIHQLVSEHGRAWHAGLAYSSVIGEAADGFNDVNTHSIGISLEGDGTRSTFMDAQYVTLTWLLKDLMSRTNITLERIVGLAYVAPDRHVAPGDRFDWNGLHQRLQAP